MTPQPNRRILVVDDMESIHEDFSRMLSPGEADLSRADLSRTETELFDEPDAGTPEPFTLHCAFQGRDALDLVVKAREAGTPYSVAIIDMRMPPGWNGVETIENIWRVDEELQVILCTAYSDIAWDEVMRRVHFRDQLVILRKPFDPLAAYQLVLSQASKWDIARQLRIESARP